MSKASIPDFPDDRRNWMTSAKARDFRLPLNPTLLEEPFCEDGSWDDRVTREAR